MKMGMWLRLVWLLIAASVAVSTASAQARVSVLSPQGVTLGAFPADPLPVFFATEDFVLAPVGTNSGFRAYWNVQGGTQLSISGESGNVFGQVLIPPALRTTPGSYPIIICNFVNFGAGPIEDCTNPATSVLFDVNPPPSFVTPATLPSALVNNPYSTQLVVTGGTPGEANAPYEFAVSGGSLPPGLSLNVNNGTLSGTPTVTGLYSFSVSARDTSGISTSRAFSLQVRPPLSFTTTSPLPSGAPGVAYSTTLQGVGGLPPFAWRLATGNLPPGLSLSITTGAITGIPTTPGVYNFVVQLEDTVSTPITRNYQITIVDTLSITTTSPLPSGVVQEAYSTGFAATGGTAPYGWSLSSGSLPPGLSLSTAGTLFGTPTTAGTYVFVLRVTDGSGQDATRLFTITIVGQLQISTASPLPPATRTASYSTTIAGQGGFTPYQWTVFSGALPGGLTLNESTGVISGTPTAAGTANFGIRLTDSQSNIAERSFQIVVAEPLVITTTSPLPNGILQSAYSTSLAASGGRTPYNWSLASGALPPGLSLSTAGVLSGTPTTNGSFNFEVRVTDADSREALRSFTLTIGQQLLITTVSPLPPATRTASYSTTIAGQGGFTPYQWTVFSGALPAGLTLNESTGVISGTPTAAGTANFGVRLTDGQSNIAERSFQIAVAEPLAITTTSPLPNGILQSAYSTSLAASGGRTPYNWSLASGALPPGLSLSAAGVLSGTPTTNGSFNFEVRVTDADSRQALRSFTLAIGQELLISTVPPLPPATRTVAYSTTIAGQGGFTPYQWTVFSGALPAGLTLNQTTGVISGTPTTAGTASFGIRLTDAQSNIAERNFQIEVAEPLAITTASPLNSGVVGTAYSSSLAAEGGVAPYQWQVVGGMVPPGLTLDSAGLLSGTPTTGGAYSFEARATDADAREATRTFAIDVEAALLITSVSPLPPATRDQSYSLGITAEGGLPPYQWQVFSGALPGGISLDAATGVLSGAPTVAGSFSFGIRVSDAGSNPDERVFELNVAEALEITTASPLPRGTQQVSYSITVAAAGGVSPYQWAIQSGNLPPGLQLDSASGVISGTPTEAGVFAVFIQVTDQDAREASSSFEIEIAPELLILTESLLAQGITGEEYAASLEGAGGTTPYVWTVSSPASLPPGLSLDAATGLLSGAPTEVGDYSFTVLLTDALEVSVQRTFNILVLDPLIITTLAALPGAAVTEPYSTALAATGGLAPLTWSLGEGETLPEGLALSAGGVLSGTPAEAGAFTIDAIVTDDQGTSAERAFTVRVVAQPVITTDTPLPGADEGEQYTFVIAVGGGRGPYEWSLAEGAVLPPGISLNTNSGLLSGIPTVSDEFQFTVTVVDSEERLATKDFTLVVTPTGPPPTILTEALPEAIEGTPYLTELEFSGGAGAVTFSFVGGSPPPGIAGPTAKGEISGVPGVPGEYTFQVRAEDVRQQTAQREYTLIVRSSLELLTSSPLPPGTVGQGFQATLQVQGGVAPYSFALSGGTVPEGLTFSPEGVLAGTPSSTFDGLLRVRLSDSSTPPQTVERDFELRIRPPLLFVTTTLDNPVLGQPYMETVVVEGGAPDYNFSVLAGTVPAGLNLNPQGQLSGDASATGTVSFTILVEDQDGRTAERVFTLLTAPALLSNVDVFLETPNPEPNAQEPLIVEIAEDAEADLEGELRMVFVADTDPPVDDPAIQFVTGGRTAPFTIPGGTRRAQFGERLSSPPIQTGTTSGEIRISPIVRRAGFDVTPDPAPVTIIRILAVAPSISDASATRTPEGVTLVLRGFSTPRTMDEAVLEFTARPGATVSSPLEVTVALADVFDEWFSSPESAQFGSRFQLTLPVNITGDSADITGVEIRLRNASGESQPITVTF